MDRARSVMLVAAALCAGCAATAAQTVTSRDDPSAEWRVRGHQNPWGKVTVTINGEPALEGKVSIWSGDGALSGSYEGRPATGTCVKERGSQARTTCRISLDGETIATLHFRL